MAKKHLSIVAMMTYEEFKFTIMDRLQTDVDDPKTITVHPVMRNNGQEMDGLVIMEGSTNIAPTIYLNPYYQAYTRGRSFHILYSQILAAYRSNRAGRHVDVRFFTNFENIRPRICWRVINYRRNEALLKDVPHSRFLDLAIVYSCLIRLDQVHGNAAILIHNSHADYWKVSQKELFSIARENSPILLPHKIQPISDVIRELIQQVRPGKASSSLTGREVPADDNGMYVLTNQSGWYGASCMFYPGLLDALSDRMGCDFYILPSSLHELILMPVTKWLKEKNDCMQQLSQTIKEINTSTLSPEEVLSDHAYYYSGQDKRISM